MRQDQHRLPHSLLCTKLVERPEKSPKSICWFFFLPLLFILYIFSFLIVDRLPSFHFEGKKKKEKKRKEKNPKLDMNWINLTGTPGKSGRKSSREQKGNKTSRCVASKKRVSSPETCKKHSSYSSYKKTSRHRKFGAELTESPEAE